MVGEKGMEVMAERGWREWVQKEGGDVILLPIPEFADDSFFCLFCLHACFGCLSASILGVCLQVLGVCLSVFGMPFFQCYWCLSASILGVRLLCVSYVSASILGVRLLCIFLLMSNLTFRIQLFFEELYDVSFVHLKLIILLVKFRVGNLHFVAFPLVTAFNKEESGRVRMRTRYIAGQLKYSFAGEGISRNQPLSGSVGRGSWWARRC